jgi:hypothetical protein
LFKWEDLGRAGHEAIAAGPDAARIADMTGSPALEPLRVYVGLNAAPDIDARAKLALAELIRITSDVMVGLGRFSRCCSRKAAARRSPSDRNTSPISACGPPSRSTIC